MIDLLAIRRYVKANAEEIYKTYKDNWIALTDSPEPHIISYDRDIRECCRKAREEVGKDFCIERVDSLAKLYGRLEIKIYNPKKVEEK